MAVDPFNANIVYTGSFGGLAKTIDGGFTWGVYFSPGPFEGPLSASLDWKTTDPGVYTVRFYNEVNDRTEYAKITIEPDKVSRLNKNMD